MANFNWFSRTFNKSSKADQPAKAAEKAAAAEKKEKEAKEAKSDSTPQTQKPENYLAWAKAAYQNIQQQQATPETPSGTSDASPADNDEPPATADPLPDSPTASTEPVEAPETTADLAATAPIADTVAAEPPTEPATATDTIAAVEATASEPAAVTDATPIDVTDANPVAPEPEVAQPEKPALPTGPAWMQASADRQARLDRLQETAIAESEPEPEAPEPKPQPVTTAAPELAFPDIDFDDAFLWSAEVLAGQGRQAADVSIEEITWLNRLRQGLGKTRRGLVNQLKAIVGQGPLNEDAVFEIEALLLQADVGVEATDAIIAALQSRLREETLPPEQAIAYLKTILRDMLDKPLGETHNLEFVPEKGSFNIWMLTGVNGAGKTTTIGKLAHIATKSGYSCLIGAADTFRAAAVEQVKAWGARSDVDVVANPGKNTDPAAVVFDAIAAAQSRDCELLLVDTAGRLQNKKNLMAELAKIRRIIDKKAPGAKVESLLVLDATLGQNGLRQAEVFAEAANLSGVVLTKLDGTAKGGIALAVVQQLNLPIRFIGAGEGIEDLRPFSSYEFVEALLSG